MINTPLAGFNKNSGWHWLVLAFVLLAAVTVLQAGLRSSLVMHYFSGDPLPAKQLIQARWVLKNWLADNPAWMQLTDVSNGFLYYLVTGLFLWCGKTAAVYGTGIVNVLALVVAVDLVADYFLASRKERLLMAALVLLSPLALLMMADGRFWGVALLCVALAVRSYNSRPVASGLYLACAMLLHTGFVVLVLAPIFGRKLQTAIGAAGGVFATLLFMLFLNTGQNFFANPYTQSGTQGIEILFAMGANTGFEPHQLAWMFVLSVFGVFCVRERVNMVKAQQADSKMQALQILLYLPFTMFLTGGGSPQLPFALLLLLPVLPVVIDKKVACPACAAGFAVAFALIGLLPATKAVSVLYAIGQLVFLMWCTAMTWRRGRLVVPT